MYSKMFIFFIKLVPILWDTKIILQRNGTKYFSRKFVLLKIEWWKCPSDFAPRNCTLIRNERWRDHPTKSADVLLSSCNRAVRLSSAYIHVKNARGEEYNSAFSFESENVRLQVCVLCRHHRHPSCQEVYLSLKPIPGKLEQ